MGTASGGIAPPVRLDSLRGGWLTPDEAAVWDEFAAMPFSENVNESDVVAVFGAAGGGIAAYIRQHHPAHLILVEEDKDNRHLLEMSWRGARGVSIINRDPAQAMAEILDAHLPSVAVLDLAGHMIRPEVIGALVRENESLDILCLRFGEMTEQARNIDAVLRTWHDGDLRWHARRHYGPLSTCLYVR